MITYFTCAKEPSVCNEGVYILAGHPQLQEGGAQQAGADRHAEIRTIILYIYINMTILNVNVVSSET
jgi:hypothetical protein